MPNRKNVLMWFILIYHVNSLKQTCGIKNVTLKAPKNLWVLWSTEKCSSRIERWLHFLWMSMLGVDVYEEEFQGRDSHRKLIGMLVQDLEKSNSRPSGIFF